MSNSHGDLFGEIGRLVLAANSGEAIDLNATAKDLAERYRNLGISEDMIATTVARSIGAIGFSMARVAKGGTSAAHSPEPVEPLALDIEAEVVPERPDPALAAKATKRQGRKMKTLFPSGVRLSLLS